MILTSPGTARRGIPTQGRFEPVAVAFPDNRAMSDDSAFRSLLRGIRAGDEQAAVAFVNQYETLVRRQVRWYMTDPKLCRLFDPEDVCQMVLASFFLRAAAGPYDVDRPEQLVRLLTGMTRNKIAWLSRKRRAQRADRRRAEGSGLEEKAQAAGPGPATEIRIRDLLQQVHERLSEEERPLKSLHEEGRSWDEIAAQLGGTAAGRRMQLTRALKRVAGELGIEEDDDG
jgi:RNA polymerase sigma-70 factor (ECF subfamily)